MVRLTFIEKKSYFNRKYWRFRFFYIQKYRNFIGSNCSKLTKHGMENHQCNESEKQKEFFLYSLPRKKISFSYGNLRLFQIRNFKNRSFLSGQEVVQIKPNLVWSIHRVGRLWDKKNGPPNFSRKSSYFNRKYRHIRLLFAHSIFKKIEILLGEGVVQIKHNSAWSITSVFRMWNKKNF